MPAEQIVPVGRPEHMLARRLSEVTNGTERTTIHERLKCAWNMLISNVARSVPRLKSDDVLALLDANGKPTVTPPWDLPLDIVWGTDRVDNGRAFVIFAVEDTVTTEKSVMTVFEQRGPTNLPIAVANMAGTVNLTGDEKGVETEDTLRGLLRLFRNGKSDFRRLVAVDGSSAKLEVTPLSLQIHKEGFAPTPGKHSKPNEELL